MGDKTEASQKALHDTAARTILELARSQLVNARRLGEASVGIGLGLGDNPFAGGDSVAATLYVEWQRGRRDQIGSREPVKSEEGDRSGG